MMHVLPKLDGRLGSVVRAIYIVLALMTTIIVAGGLIFNALDFFRNAPVDTRWGLRTFGSLTPGGAPLVAWTSPQAHARGLRENDVIVAIQGQSLPPGASEYTIGKRLAEITGNSAAITTRHPDNSVATHIVPRAASVWTTRDFQSGLPLWLSLTLGFLDIHLIPLFLLGASLLLFRRRPKDSEAMLFATGFLLLCNVPVADYWLLAVLNVPVSSALAMLTAGQFIVIAAGAGFPDGRFDSAWSRAVLIAAFPLAVLNAIAHNLAANAQISGAISGAGLLILGAMAAVSLSRRYRLIRSGPARQQIKWVVLGFSVSAIATAAYMWLLESAGPFGSPAEYIAFQIFQIVAFLALPLGLVVSLLRYRLYDAEATISRSAAYLLLTAALVFLFAASEKVIELLGSDLFGGSIGAVAGGISAGLAAVMFTPLHHRIHEWARHRFQHHLVRLREGLPMLVGDLREVAEVKQLARTVLARVSEGVHAQHLALLVGDQLLAAHDIEPDQVRVWQAQNQAFPVKLNRIARSDRLFPLRISLRIDEETPIGHLLLGPRPDGSFYGSDEIEALTEIASPVARAIIICQQREAGEATLVAQVKSLVWRMDQVEKMLRRHNLHGPTDSEEDSLPSDAPKFVPRAG